MKKRYLISSVLLSLVSLGHLFGAAIGPNEELLKGNGTVPSITLTRGTYAIYQQQLQEQGVDILDPNNDIFLLNDKQKRLLEKEPVRLTRQGFWLNYKDKHSDFLKVFLKQESANQEQDLRRQAEEQWQKAQQTLRNILTKHKIHQPQTKRQQIANKYAQQMLAHDSGHPNDEEENGRESAQNQDLVLNNALLNRL